MTKGGVREIGSHIGASFPIRFSYEPMKRSVDFWDEVYCVDWRPVLMDERPYVSQDSFDTMVHLLDVLEGADMEVSGPLLRKVSKGRSSEEIMEIRRLFAAGYYFPSPLGLVASEEPSSEPSPPPER